MNKQNWFTLLRLGILFFPFHKLGSKGRVVTIRDQLNMKCLTLITQAKFFQCISDSYVQDLDWEGWGFLLAMCSDLAPGSKISTQPLGNEAHTASAATSDDISQLMCHCITSLGWNSAFQDSVQLSVLQDFYIFFLVALLNIAT